MNIYGYGEDSWTLFVLKHKQQELLTLLNDKSYHEDCVALYRPCFGRKIGFGEFDFIIFSNDVIYLGESKLVAVNRKSVTIKLKPCQTLRHEVMKKLIESWYNTQSANNDLGILNIVKNPRGRDLILLNNLLSLKKLVTMKYSHCPEMKNVLLIMSKSAILGKTITDAANFHIITMDIRETTNNQFPNYVEFK